MAGYRLDKALAILFPSYSRARLQQWIRQGHVLVDAVPVRGKDKVHGGEDIQISVQLEEEVTWKAQELPLIILYEDDDIIVVNKPAGVVVHPGAGNHEGTLINALLHHAPMLAQLPRGGVIHRLDKDTSGVLVIARRLSAHTQLVEQLQSRAFIREYQAVVNGILVSGGCIDVPLGRHPTHRTKRAVVAGGKTAITHYRVIQRYRAHTHVRVQLETGRTHQIRVHMAYKEHPIIGDAAYGGRLRVPSCSQELADTLRHFPRQALHAEHLGLQHPRTGELMQWHAPLPQDMCDLLTQLEIDRHRYA